VQEIEKWYDLENNFQLRKSSDFPQISSSFVLFEANGSSLSTRLGDVMGGGLYDTDKYMQKHEKRHRKIHSARFARTVNINRILPVLPVVLELKSR